LLLRALVVAFDRRPGGAQLGLCCSAPPTVPPPGPALPVWATCANTGAVPASVFHVAFFGCDIAHFHPSLSLLPVAIITVVGPVYHSELFCTAVPSFFSSFLYFPFIPLFFYSQ
jgi:hypothetical protein